MNANEEERPLTRQTPFDVLLPYVVDTYLTPEKLDPYLLAHESPFNRQALVDFFQSDLIAERMAQQWDYERSDQWPQRRSSDTAMYETIRHCLAQLLDETKRYLENRVKPTTFSTQPREDVLSINAKLGLLADYFREVLPIPPGYHL